MEYYTLQWDGVEALVVVVVCSVEPRYNDGYMRTINCLNNIWYSMQILEFIRKFIYD